MQIKNLWNYVPAQPGDRFLSVLPPWHVYERACEYFLFSYGAEQVYTNIKRLKVCVLWSLNLKITYITGSQEYILIKIHMTLYAL